MIIILITQYFQDPNKYRGMPVKSNNNTPPNLHVNGNKYNNTYLNA